MSRRNRNGEWQIKPCSKIQGWSQEKRLWIPTYLQEQINNGGFVYGVFADDRLVGFCSVDGTILGTNARYANLTMLFVDDDYKRKGIGSALFERACHSARQIGADKLFGSAIPSVDTVAFYARTGCTDADEIIDDFVDTEKDGYMEKKL